MYNNPFLDEHGDSIEVILGIDQSILLKILLKKRGMNKNDRMVF